MEGFGFYLMQPHIPTKSFACAALSIGDLNHFTRVIKSFTFDQPWARVGILIDSLGLDSLFLSLLPQLSENVGVTEHTARMTTGWNSLHSVQLPVRLEMG